MIRMARFAIPLLCIVALACGDDDDETTSRNPNAPSEAAATVTATGALDVIEFRVIGNPVSATIRYTTSVDGTSQVTTGLPFTVTLRSNRERLFVSLDVAVQVASPSTLNTFVIAQIFINGQLFREAYGAGILPTVNASGTFNHGQLITVN